MPAALIAIAAQTYLPATSWPVLFAECLLVIALYAVTSLLLLFTPRDLKRFALEGARRLRARRERVSAIGLAANRRSEEVDAEAIR
jgi:hypothetical protein